MGVADGQAGKQAGGDVAGRGGVDGVGRRWWWYCGVVSSWGTEYANEMRGWFTIAINLS